LCENQFIVKYLRKISKKRQECFVGIEKSSTFASAFRKEQHLKKSSLKDLDMNKQVVQDCSIKNYKLIIKN